MKRDRFTFAINVFKKNNSILRMSDAMKQGVPQYIIYAMLSDGILIREERGLYRLAGDFQLSNPDLVKVSLLIPKSIICLTSALYFYNLTTQIPRSVFIALPRNIRIPKVTYPPIDVIRLSSGIYSAGVEEHFLDGIKVRIYGPEKTIADCFKYRGRLGEDLAIEALKSYISQHRPKLDLLIEFARLDRVEKILRPYLVAVA